MALRKSKKLFAYAMTAAMTMNCMTMFSLPVCAAEVENVAQDRTWNFTYFGQSSNEERNTFEMIDPEELSFKLNSCTYKEDGTIDKKGGKFTTYHDGISYYYTEIDADTENFELTGTFTVDYINPTADGQEGFGILAMDSLGEHGVSSTNHYTNSAAILATKFEGMVDGAKRSSKDTIGTRFVSGITKDVLAEGDTGIAASGKNVSTAYSLDEKDLVKQGESYTLTLKKTNTGFEAELEGYDEERIMYGVDKLLQLDSEKIYVGFAVARGCNVTVSDVSMKITDPKTDPAALPAPEETVDVKTKVDSPTTYALDKYPFVYTANADGKITVKDSEGNVIVKDEAITAGKDYTNTFDLKEGENKFSVSFVPSEGYKIGGFSLTSYDAVSTTLKVKHQKFDGKAIYVSPEGTSKGDGTEANPVDISTATQYVAPGQTIYLAGGTYTMKSALKIERGIDGTEKEMITLRSKEGERAVFDFSNAPAGMQLWGNYWHVYGIDVCNTPGNIKGLQIAGNNNKIELVNTYNNGDTGLQISGTSSETIDKWPANNLILNCTSYDNCDPGMNNADGFAAKITCGEGNVFKGCIAYNNLDDGWDLFSKIESGPIGAVTIDSCIAYANGTLTNGEGNGDGNGFKLGGDGIAVPHVLKNSISFNNNTAGITSNSDPAIILENNTSFGNKGLNITLYGKGDAKLQFIAKNNISMHGGAADEYGKMASLKTKDNYFFDGKQSVNSEGKALTADIFESVDVTKAPTRNEDGSINMNGLLTLKEGKGNGSGATLK
ncbi:MAG: right-handed parallel beta-helix repeat-containing protein [Cellulosilyticum sp.]|nr:right-handed parallel beta-helix repeat-containing protein [Cellulosilyticum sp.]